MRLVAFEKYEGLGNDFLVVEASDDSFDEGEVRAACERRFGVGGDGVLLVLPPTTVGAVARMKVVNADGSVPEMCGNGLRCVALHVARSHALGNGAITIDTDAGPRHCTIEDAGGEGMITVDMGPARVDDDVSIVVDGATIALTRADVGNPHAVTFRSADDLARLGPVLATHAAFPQGANVELVTVRGARLDVVVWERGVGATLACGTGACAAAAVAVHKGLAPRGTTLDVHLPGGMLAIRIDDAGHAILRGPARHVFSGRWGARP